MKKALALLFLTVFPLHAFACGTVAKSFSSLMLETRKDVLEKFLKSHSCSNPASYSPDNADHYITLVLNHAVHAEVDSKIVEDVLFRYNCVAQASHTSAHKQIVSYVGRERYEKSCSKEILSKIFVVSAKGGANLRLRPGVNSKKLGAIAEGAAVTNAIIEGDWVNVSTYVGNGYMHISTLRPYIIDD